MFPLWEVAVAPVLEAANAHTIVEIGALRGENTRQIIDRLGSETVLHVIDPLPDFDPEEHEREFAGQYVFHRDLSLNVLGDLPPMDAALVDGDHNWYTVYNELRLLREVARANDAPLPLLVLHDVGWPYGRRDLYYDPENIPVEFRKEWAHKGMMPGKRRLVRFGGGLNPTLANAMVEGGRRNGVRTGLDDFVAEHDRPLRQVVLPIYFGLAIVAEEERLERQPALAATLDRLESLEGKDALLQVAEDIRIEDLIFHHRIFYDRDRSLDRLGGRYLSQVVDGWIGEAAGGDVLRQLQELLDEVRANYVRGDVAAVGLDMVEPGLFLRTYLDAFDRHGRDAWAFGAAAPRGGVDGFRAGLERLELGEENSHLVDVTTGLPVDVELPDQLAVVLVGDGLGSDPDGLLDAVHARLSHGGLLLVHPAASEATRTAVERLRGRVHGSIAGDGVGPGGLGWRVAGAEAAATASGAAE